MHALFAYIGRDGDDVPVELIPLNNSSVTVAGDPMTAEPIYTVSDSSGAQRQCSRHDILHLRGPGRSIYRGDSPIHECREAIAYSLLLEDHGINLFKRGARPGGILKYPKPMRPEMFDRLRSSFEGGFAGACNTGRTVILEDGMSFEQSQFTCVDSQYLELRRFQLEEVCRVFRLPPHLAGDLQRATFNNTEQMGQQFLTYCILPILRIWQEAIGISLLTRDERKTYYAEALVDDLARADLQARFTAYSQAINASVLNPNEIRGMENRPPYAGGDVFTRPVNSAPVDEATAPQSQPQAPSRRPSLMTVDQMQQVMGGAGGNP